MSGFTILTVCSGNICRSPLAEQVLTAQLQDIPQIRVASAGTIADARLKMPKQAMALSRRYGGDPSNHMVRQLDPDIIREAGLVLAMAREHRREAVTKLPRASRHTFTLREFARLTALVTPRDFLEVTAAPLEDVAARLKTAVHLVAMYRGTIPPLDDPLGDDVVDPYEQADKVYERSASQLIPAVDTVSAYLRRAATQPAPPGFDAST